MRFAWAPHFVPSMRRSRYSTFDSISWWRPLSVYTNLVCCLVSCPIYFDRFFAIKNMFRPLWCTHFRVCIAWKRLCAGFLLPTLGNPIIWVHQQHLLIVSVSTIFFRKCRFWCFCQNEDVVCVNYRHGSVSWRCRWRILWTLMGWWYFLAVCLLGKRRARTEFLLMRLLPPGREKRR